MVKPGGTGRPRLLISARLAPLPPSRFFISALPSALPSPKPYTHFAISQVPRSFSHSLSRREREGPNAAGVGRVRGTLTAVLVLPILARRIECPSPARFARTLSPRERVTTPRPSKNPPPRPALRESATA